MTFEHIAVQTAADDPVARLRTRLNRRRRRETGLLITALIMSLGLIVAGVLQAPPGWLPL